MIRPGGALGDCLFCGKARWLCDCGEYEQQPAGTGTGEAERD